MYKLLFLFFLSLLNLNANEIYLDSKQTNITIDDYEKALKQFEKKKKVYISYEQEKKELNKYKSKSYIYKDMYKCSKYRGDKERIKCYSFFSKNKDNKYSQNKLAEIYYNKKDYIKAIYWFEKSFYNSEMKNILSNKEKLSSIALSSKMIKVKKLIYSYIHTNDYFNYAFWLDVYKRYEKSSKYKSNIDEELYKFALSYKKTNKDKYFNIINELSKYSYYKILTELAIAYEYGIGTNKDQKSAFVLYKQASKKNYAFAQRKVAIFYFNEKPKKLRQAFEYFKLASKKDKLSIDWMGYFYESGFYVKKDLKKAKKWYEKSYSKYAKDRLKIINKKRKF